MSTLIEYGILALALVCTTVLMALSKIQSTDGMLIITTVVGYAVGASRTKTLNSAQAAQVQGALAALNNPKQ